MTGWDRLGTGGLPPGFRRLVLPGDEQAIQRDPNEVIIGM